MKYFRLENGSKDKKSLNSTALVDGTQHMWK